MMTRRNLLLASSALAWSPTLAASPRLRIGQIGTEHAHAAGKMEAIRSLPDLYEVAGIASKTAPQGNAFSGLPLMSEAALLATPGLQAVAIETRVEDSCAAALRAISTLRSEAAMVDRREPVAFSSSVLRMVSTSVISARRWL